MECSSNYKPTLYLIRGLPGSGKSTLAQLICANLNNAAHLEADMYFVDEKGKYVFDSSKIADAHKACQRWARDALFRRVDTIVSNTFTQRWELAPYLEMAKELNATVMEIVCKGDFPNVHSVPFGTIERMKARWED